MTHTIELLLVAFAYLVGSIPFAYIFVRSITGRDVRAEGSGNVGATNALRSAGWKVGVAVTVLDTGDTKQYIFASNDTIWVVSDPLGERDRVEEAITSVP